MPPQNSIQNSYLKMDIILITIYITTVTIQKSCTTQIILYPLQVSGNSYHIYMVIYKYSICIFDMNMRSGSHALLYVGIGSSMGWGDPMELWVGVLMGWGMGWAFWAPIPRIPILPFGL